MDSWHSILNKFNENAFNYDSIATELDIQDNVDENAISSEEDNNDDFKDSLSVNALANKKIQEIDFVHVKASEAKRKKRILYVKTNMHEESPLVNQTEMKFQLVAEKGYLNLLFHYIEAKVTSKYAEQSRIRQMCEKQEACFWTAEEIDLYGDLRDWNNLNENEKSFIKYVLAFFAASDGIVLENIGRRFFLEFQVPEIRDFYAFQLAMENIHSETYSLLIDCYLQSNLQEQIKIFRAINHIKAVESKALWALKWINNENSIAERLLAFCAVEGILFSGSFCAIFWMKKRGLLPGLTFSNELISRDEGMHTEFGALLYSSLENRLPENEAHQIILEALDVERKFILEALTIDLIGMNSKLMIQYLEYVSDRLLKDLGYNSIFNSENPFSWMELISIQGKTNFFEKRVSDYQLAGATSIDLDNKFDQNAEF
uniref:Ribonucleoside-diphosphate reductase small subunit-like n=1 Tax=Dermatophagoides pteronyssinus TaxID=6956 RepID=A0A6P6Y9U1_DERPT|nr:ribonucleoside-diphosphate reductase small subunit-like [Dermatophagoides pteronyssinus]